MHTNMRTHITSHTVSPVPSNYLIFYVRTLFYSKFDYKLCRMNATMSDCLVNCHENRRSMVATVTPSDTHPSSISHYDPSISPDTYTLVETHNTSDLRHSSRACQAPPHHWNFKIQHASSSSFRTHYPLQRYLSYSRSSNSYHSLLTNTSLLLDPAIYEQAWHNPQWVSAMDFEIKGLQDNEPWSIVLVPPNQWPIECKWVFKIKYHADGIIECHKAWLFIE